MNRFFKEKAMMKLWIADNIDDHKFGMALRPYRISPSGNTGGNDCLQRAVFLIAIT